MWKQKKRTHRLCQIGGAVESVLGAPIEEEDIPKLIGFLKKQEANGKFFSKAMQKETNTDMEGSVMADGMSFSFPSLLFHEGRTYGQPEVVPISLPQVSTVCAHACRARSVGGLSARPAHAAGGTLRQRAHSMQAVMHRASYAEGVPADTIFFWGKRLPAGNQSRIRRKGETEHGDFSLYSKDCWIAAKGNPSYQHLRISMVM